MPCMCEPCECKSLGERQPVCGMCCLREREREREREKVSGVLGWNVCVLGGGERRGS